MNDRDLRRALRELPVPRAGDGFTRDVLARLERPRADGDTAPKRIGSPYPRILAAAATLALAFGAVAAWQAGVRHDRQERIRSLEAESSRIRGEIRALEDRLEDPATLLYVGGTESVDLVVDLSRLSGLSVPPGTEDGHPDRTPGGGVL